MKAFIGATAANGFDFDSMDDSFDLSESTFLDDFRWGSTTRGLRSPGDGGRVVYLLDNAGESVFDGVLIEVFGEMYEEVVLDLKERRFLNDVAREDVERLGLLKEVDGVIARDAPFFGLGGGFRGGRGLGPDPL